MWARRSCPSWRIGLAGLLLACSLLTSAATTALASGPLSGQPITVAAVPATVQRAAAPVVNTVHVVRQTAQRSVAATTTVAQAPAAVQRTVTAVSSTVTRSARGSSAKPASSRKTPRHRRGGGAVAKAAALTPAPAAKRFPVSGATAVPVAADAGVAAEPRSLAPRPPAPRTERAATVAPVDDPGSAPAAPSSAAAASPAGSSAGATALLTLLFLVAFAAPRLGALLRLPAAQAPMPPLLAIPERPG